MKPSINLAAMLVVAGGLAAATAPSIARANCNLAASSAPGGGASGPEAPQYDAKAEFATGVAALDAKNYTAAKRAFDHVLSVVPQNGDVLYLAGLSRMGLNDWAGARKKLERAVKIKPDMILAQRDLGVTYAKLADAANAKLMIARLEKASTVCAGSCPDAANLKLAIDQVKAVMPAEGLAEAEQVAAKS